MICPCIPETGSKAVRSTLTISIFSRRDGGTGTFVRRGTSIIGGDSNLSLLNIQEGNAYTGLGTAKVILLKLRELNALVKHV